MEGCKVGYCYREEPDGDWDSGWRFTAGDESDDYMDDPNNAGLYKLNTICNDDSDIIPLLNTPAPCAFERDEHGVFQPIKDWKPENEEEPDMDILQRCQKWHETDEYQKIIDALEAIPAEERTPEMDSELARAYNNLADPNKPGGKDMLKKAIALLKPMRNTSRATTTGTSAWAIPIIIWTRRGAPFGTLKRRWRPARMTRIPKN